MYELKLVIAYTVISVLDWHMYQKFYLNITKEHP